MTHDSEEQLAAYVVRWLQDQHWDVFQEVRPGWRGEIADIVAVRTPLVWTIECKRSCSLTVIAQAQRWKTTLRSIAVPCSAARNHKRKDPHRQFAFDVCRKFEIGVLEVGRTGEIYEPVKPPILRCHKRASDAVRRRLHPAQRDYLPAGSKSGSRWTPYRHTLNAARRIIQSKPGCTLDEILQELVNDHEYCDSVSLTSVANALVEWEDWCVTDESAMPRRYYVQGSEPPEVTHLLYLESVQENA